jgi:glycosyltransferase involved in cell wall biosynthesis
MAQEKDKRVIMAVINDLVTDQRIHRSCLALQESGWQVLLVGRLLPSSKSVSRSYATQRMRLLFRRSAFFYAEYNLRLFLKLLFVHADLFYANDTDTLPATYCAARLRHKSIFFDAHELFPEVPEVVSRPRVKKVWQKLEDYFFPKLRDYKYGAACVTVCRSIANYYYRKYRLPMDIVRNVPLPYDASTIKPANIPALDDNSSEMNPTHKDILLYQGAVNIGRGLEVLVDAMSYLDSCVLVIIGTGDIINDICARARMRGVEDKVLILGRVSPDELRHYTVRANLGMSLLDNMGLSYYYAFPNRIADFVQAGVPVLATDFPEMHQVIESYNIGTLVPDGMTDPRRLAVIIQDTLLVWKRMDPQEKVSRFMKARQELCWTYDKQIFLSAVDKLWN